MHPLNGTKLELKASTVSRPLPCSCGRLKVALFFSFLEVLNELAKSFDIKFSVTTPGKHGSFHTYPGSCFPANFGMHGSSHSETNKCDD